MNSHEISGAATYVRANRILDKSDIALSICEWLKEIAYQLAIANERENRRDERRRG